MPAEKQHEEMGRGWMGRKEGKREKEQERMSRAAEGTREKEAEKGTEDMMERGGREQEGSGQKERKHKDRGRSGTRRRSCVSHIRESVRLTGGSSLLTVQPDQPALCVKRLSQVGWAVLARHLPTAFTHTNKASSSLSLSAQSHQRRPALSY